MLKPQGREAWLCGALEGVSPIMMPAAHALAQAAADIERAASDLSVAETWTKPNGAPSAGFHLRHIAGSIDRLLTYARGEQLDARQFAELAVESAAGEQPASAAMLIENSNGRINEALTVIKATPEDILFIPRAVGRERHPTNVFGLLFHIAEHTQRHTGQIITIARIVRADQD